MTRRLSSQAHVNTHKLTPPVLPHSCTQAPSSHTPSQPPEPPHLQLPPSLTQQQQPQSGQQQQQPTVASPFLSLRPVLTSTAAATASHSPSSSSAPIQMGHLSSQAGALTEQEEHTPSSSAPKTTAGAPPQTEAGKVQGEDVAAVSPSSLQQSQQHQEGAEATGKEGEPSLKTEEESDTKGRKKGHRFPWPWRMFHPLLPVVLGLSTLLCALAAHQLLRRKSNSGAVGGEGDSCAVQAGVKVPGGHKTGVVVRA